MEALKASPEYEAQEEAQVEDAQPPPEAAPRVHTIADFEQWWTRSEELDSILRRLPRDVVSAADMGNRRSQLLERWEDLETPEVNDEEVDEEVLGALLSWIRDSETLIHYIIYTRDVRRDHDQDGATANDTDIPTSASASAPTVDSPLRAPIQPSLSVVNTISEVPGVNENWRWPWITGWDDPDARNQILHPKKKKKAKLTVKRAATMGALGAGAVYVFSRYLDE